MHKHAFACVATLAVFGALGTSQAYANVTTSVHIAGSALGRGGTIALEGLAIPAGTCGIRWHNPQAWAWWPDVADVLPNSATYGDPKELAFTGPYPGCGSDPYWFPYPLTVDGKAPFPWATTLMVQVKSPDDIEFLDKHANSVPPVPGPGPDPKPRAICEIKDFCESKTKEIDAGPNPTHSGAQPRPQSQVTDAPAVGARAIRTP